MSVSQLKVLVLEDEALISMMLEDWLSDLACTSVGPVASIEEALRTIETIACDAAILDLNVRGGEAYPVAEALRSRGVPVAFATGGHPAEIVQRCPGADVLAKPYDFEAVKRLVDKWTAERVGDPN